MKVSIFAIVTWIIISLVFVFQPIGGANAQEETDTLAKTRYSDLNGFFKIVPPEGWQVQNYPEDPRGKVTFYGPDGVELRVLAQGHDYNSFEEFLEAIKEMENQFGTNTNIEIITFAGQPAVKRTFIFSERKILFIDFIIGNTKHNLMYVASPAKFENYLSLVLESIDTYESTLSGVSPEDVKKHTLARKLQLSRLLYEQGNYDLALQFINEGLEIEPKNTSLLELQNKISGSINAQTIGEEQNTNNDRDNIDSSDNQGPNLFIILSLVGAILITFRKGIANGTALPEVASITVPIMGAVAIIYGLQGLFDGGYIFFGIVTSLITLLILASPVLVRLISGKRSKE